MNEKYYKLTRGRLHRVDKSLPTGYATFNPGDVFVPTDTELQHYRDNLEGPVEMAEEEGTLKPVVKPEPAQTTAQVLAARAERDLAMGLQGIRDALRTADIPYLEALRVAEAAHKPSPRAKVIEMIDRRLRIVTQVA